MASLKKAEHVEVTPKIVEIDTFRVVGISEEDAEFYKQYPEEKRKKIFQKVSNIMVSLRPLLRRTSWLTQGDGRSMFG